MSLVDDNTAFLVLNGAHLKKMATAADIAAAVGVTPEAAEAELAKVVEQGSAMNMDGRYLLAPEATALVHELYAKRYASLRDDAAVKAWYERFETLNDQFIKAVSDWQKSDGDEKALSRVLKVVERLVKALRDLTPAIPRYENYVRRFTQAIGRIDQGQQDYVCGPTIDSAHTIWFEFHEDILSVLGRPRDV
jgi:hypothetical protein